MDDVPRRMVLAAGASALASLGIGSVGARPGGKPIEEVISVTDPVPENLGFDDQGNLYVGITGGAARRLPAERTDETGLTVDDLELVAEYPGGVAGVIVADGTLYTAVNEIDSGPLAGGSGVFSVDLESDGSPAPLAAIPGGEQGVFANDLFPDDANDRLLVTESFGGVVYEVPLGGGEATVWSDSALLDTPSFGANGITRVDGDVFVNVTATGDGGGRIVRIPVTHGGEAGDATAFVEGPSVAGADGLTARGPQLYVALNAQNRIARVTPSGRVRTVVKGGPLSFPSEVVFDPTARGKTFVCNFSPGDSEDGGVLRTRP